MYTITPDGINKSMEAYDSPSPIFFLDLEDLVNERLLKGNVST
jgi:hypothetical protein